MKRAPKIIQCKTCNQEISANAKSCPHCGAKNKRPFYKKWWFWLIVAFIVIGAASSGNDSGSTDDTTNPPASSSPVNSDATGEPIEEDTPNIELSTDFERSVYDIVKENNGELTSIETVTSEGSEEATVIASILCENDENVVNKILSEISEAIKNNATNESAIFTFGDIEDGDDATALVMAGVYSDGTIDISSMSIDYNSERNNWIRNQFSAWDGSHVELEKLIISNLNDEKSYEHIETTYRDIATEDDRDEINQILADSGYTQRVEVGDLFIQTQFSAKNAFGGVIKNTAFGIASYSDNTITLIDIG